MIESVDASYELSSLVISFLHNTIQLSVFISKKCLLFTSYRFVFTAYVCVWVGVFAMRIEMEVWKA